LWPLDLVGHEADIYLEITRGGAELDAHYGGYLQLGNTVVSALNGERDRDVQVVLRQLADGVPQDNVDKLAYRRVYQLQALVLALFASMHGLPRSGVDHDSRYLEGLSGQRDRGTEYMVLASTCSSVLLCSFYQVKASYPIVKWYTT
jgi:hypothetical protein